MSHSSVSQNKSFATKPISDTQLIEAITKYHTQGIAVVPFYINANGKKKPDIPKWSHWKTQPQTDTEFETAKNRILKTRMFGVVTGTKITINGEDLYLCIVDRDVKDTALSEETKARSLETIKRMPTTRTINTRSGGQHLEYLSRIPVKGIKFNTLGLELLAYGNLCVMYPSTGYTLQNDNLPTIVECAETVFTDAVEATDTAHAATDIAQVASDMARVAADMAHALKPPSTDKPQKCQKCLHWDSWYRECRLGYQTTRNSKPCRQGVKP